MGILEMVPLLMIAVSSPLLPVGECQSRPGCSILACRRDTINSGINKGHIASSHICRIKIQQTPHK
jgi:hypothetical protein